MTNDYDAISALHYASYRPSLHVEILRRYLSSTQYNAGLDIGCGTGQSAIALAEFCQSVIAIDPSPEMISRAIAHSKVNYTLFDKKHFACQDNTFDIITLAGSLWYAKSQQLLDEIVRVGSENCMVIVYDFELLLDDILTKIGFDTRGDSLLTYSHTEDFSGLDTHQITKIDKSSERVQIQIATKDLTHLLLSVKEQYTSMVDLYGSNALYDTIKSMLSALSDSGSFTIQANTFATVYRLN
ncbi:MAG: class I SAM-dependent methyltransferase [Maribacter sp.]|uniref:class I SAM-dependent methyltransferase n=1 Tax=Maribacter sp. TaxID=1897614 RepID=UPI0032993D23